MAKSVLIIDDQERFLETLKRAVQSIGYEVDVSLDAQGALHLVSLKAYDAIICDINMPHTSGFDFLKQAKEVTKSPIILMTGFVEISDAETATREGAKGFIAKPFSLPDIKKLLTELTEVSPGTVEAKPLTDDDFFPLAVDEFISGKKIQYDLFIRVRSEKYLKIAHGGEDLDPTRIAAFKSKGLKSFYLRKQDYKRYISFLMNVNVKISKNKDIDLLKRVKMLQVASEVNMKGMFLGVMKEPELSESKMLMTCVHEIITEDESFLTLVEALKSGGDVLYNHALGVSVVAVMIARALQWTSQSSIFSIGMAGFFHDIGKRELPAALLTKNRLEYSYEEVALYETHPVRGANLLAANPKFPVEVVQAVLQHHETCSGTGFPKHLTRIKIIPIARIIAIADEFVKEVLANNFGTPVPPREVLRRMKTVKADQFDAEYLSALETVLLASK
jgi:response regulator RpfG family c-di-GMP phosphodiesterase